MFKNLIALGLVLIGLSNLRAETIEQIVERHVQRVSTTNLPNLVKKVTKPDGTIEEYYANGIGLRESPAQPIVEPSVIVKSELVPIGTEVTVLDKTWNLNGMTHDQAFTRLVAYDVEPMFVRETPQWWTTRVNARPGLLERLRQNRLARIAARNSAPITNISSNFLQGGCSNGQCSTPAINVQIAGRRNTRF